MCLLLGAWIIDIAVVTAQQPSLVRVNPDDGSLVIQVFDVITLRDGTVLYANPNWSKKLSRPVELSNLDELLYTPYSRSKGSRGIPIREVQELKYWESIATEESVRRMNRNDYGVADALVRRLEQFNPRWDSNSALRARIETMRAKVKIEKQGMVKEGLSDLEGLRRRFVNNKDVEQALVGTLLRLADEALGAEDPDMAGDYLHRAGQLYANNRQVRKTRADWNSEAAGLIQIAERAQKSDSGSAIASAQRVIRLTPDADLRRRARIVIRNAEGLLLASYEDPGAFEPINATRPVERQIVRLMHDFLMERNDTGTQYGKSELVVAIRQKSLGAQYEVELNQGLRFSDGLPLTAVDVAASIELLKNPGGEAHDAEWSRFVKSAQLMSPYTIRIDVDPHPRPDSLLYIPVVSANTFKLLPKRGTRESRSPTVSGPYRLGGIYPNGNVELVANGQFRNPPQIGKMTFRRYVQRGTGHAVNDLLQERIHTITDPSPAQIERIKNVPAKFVTKRIEPNNVWVLALNHRSTLFGDSINPNGKTAARDLRRAVALAIDRQGILNQYFNLGGKANLSHAVISGPFPRQSPAYDRSVTPRQANPAAARSLVNRYVSNVSNKRLVLKFADQGDVVETAMVQIKRDLEAVGFQIDLQKRPTNAFLRELRSGTFDLAYYQIEHDNVLFNIANIFDSTPEAIKSGQNFMRYNNQALNQMFEELRLAKEGGQIWTIQNGIHRFINTESVVVPLWQLDTYLAYTRRLVGRTRGGESMELPIDSSHIFRNVDQWYLKPIQ